MQTLQTASSRRVLSELTPSRTNVLQLSFLKRRRASSISHGTEISPQKEVLSEKQLKRFKESDLDLSCSDSESISCDYIDTLSPHAKHYEKQVDMEPNILLEDDCANVHTDCVLKNEVLEILISNNHVSSKLRRNVAINLSYLILIFHILIKGCFLNHFSYQKSKLER